MACSAECFWKAEGGWIQCCRSGAHPYAQQAQGTTGVVTAGGLGREYSCIETTFSVSAVLSITMNISLKIEYSGQHSNF